MNQSILFPDIQHWDKAEQAVVFPVQVQGVNITCLISLVGLQKLTATDIVLENEDDILAKFEQVRFDIEDKVEELIESQAYDESSGTIEIE